MLAEGVAEGEGVLASSLLVSLHSLIVGAIVIGNIILQIATKNPQKELSSCFSRITAVHDLIIASVRRPTLGLGGARITGSGSKTNDSGTLADNT